MILFNADAGTWTDNIWSIINEADQSLFKVINHSFTSPYLDQAALAFREPKTWLPLYLFLLFFSVWKFKYQSWVWVLMFVVTVTISDQVSSHFLKNYFNRIRPCGDPMFSQYVRLVLGRCPTSGSFTSSHAANHFAMATFVVRTFRPYLLKWRYLFFLWATIVSLSQVYVGVHYPLDIVGGTLLGICIGYLTSWFLLKKMGYTNQMDKLT